MLADCLSKSKLLRIVRGGLVNRFQKCQLLLKYITQLSRVANTAVNTRGEICICV